MTRPVKSTPAQRSDTRANGVVPKPAPDVEVGVSAFLPFVMPYKDAWEALRTEDLTVKQLQAMRRTDGQARALYRLITLPIRAALKTATFVPEDQVEGGEEEAEFIARMFTLPASGGGMTVPFNRVIAQMLLAVFDGFAAFEMVYQSPSDGPLKGKWVLKKLAQRPSETLTFLIDERSEFAGFRQQTMYLGQHIDKRLPAEHCVYYAANEEERPLYGQSYFASAFAHWDKKFRLYVIAHLAAQRAAVGTRIGKLPKNPNREEKLAFQKGLADLGAFQWMTVPEDYDVESLREATGFDFLALINHHNSQMSKSVLAAFFDKEQGGGDSGKLVDFGQQSDSLFLLMLETIMGEIEEVINQKIIPRFIDWNFGSGRYPRFQFGNLSEQQRAAMLELFKQLAVAGMSLTIRPELVHELEKQVAEQFGLEIDWETIEVEMAEEKAAMDAAEELAAQEQAGVMGPGAAPGAAPGMAPGAGAGVPEVDPSILPEGFALSSWPVDLSTDPAALALSDLARELVSDLAAEAAGAAVPLTRGVPTSGGPKFVRTPAGARVYGEPIGTPITRDMEERLKAHGVKGKPFGGGIKDPNGKKTRTGGDVLGGGPGAAPQNPGTVAADTGETSPQRVLGHPDQPGVQLLDFGDGTVAIRDANGVIGIRQRYDLERFLALGWKIARRVTGKHKTTRGGNTADPVPSDVAPRKSARKPAAKPAAKKTGGTAGRR